jgi:2-polyprenyl-3-methyl-5-hydroxy-6-metoxy-1,4-benzoquinol methylase
MPTESLWITGWLKRLPVGLSLIDVAAGDGKHAIWAANCGFKVTAIDRRADLNLRYQTNSIEFVCADLESGPMPIPDRQFDCVVVSRYLWRPRWFALSSWLAPAGILLYETFAQGQQRYGRPNSDAFLLGPGELITRATHSGLRVLAYEDGYSAQPDHCRVQRLCAVGPRRQLESIALD